MPATTTGTGAGSARRGVFLPPFDAFADPRRTAELALLAEEAGWDAVFLWDHMAYADPVQAIGDPWIHLAAIAARTDRILLGPMVTPLARRRVQVVARQSAALDLLAEGRLVLGFGLGEEGGGELAPFGDETDARRRAALLDEGLPLLRALLGGESVRHDGPLLRAAGRFLPTPAHPIPFWIAGRAGNRRPVERAARWDGFFPIGLQGPDDLADLRQRLPRNGSLDQPFDLVVDVPADAPHGPWAQAGADWVLTRFGPYRLDTEAVTRAVAAGPPR